MKYLYKYPQRAFPYAQLVEENRRRGTAGAGVRAGRHRRLRRQPLLRRLRRVREGVAERHPDPHHRRQSRPTSTRRSTCCRRSGFATPGRGRPTRLRPSSQPNRRARPPIGASSARGPRTLHAALRGHARAALHRERDEQRAHLRHRQLGSPFVKDGINDYVVHWRNGCGEPGAARARRPPVTTRLLVEPRASRLSCGCG